MTLTVSATPAAPPLRIAYDRVGDGDPALLMLPGWGGNRADYRELLLRLGRSRTAVTMDWRGHGGSCPAEGDFGSIELVADAMAVIHEAGLERVVPVAFSHSGWIAIELQRQLGTGRIPAIVSLNWTVLTPPPKLLATLAGLRDGHRWGQTRSELIQSWSTGAESDALMDHVSHLGRHGFEMWSRAAREIAADFDAYKTPVAALRQNATPFLHLYSQPADPALLAAQATFAQTHPWFRVERLTGTSHFPALELPAETADAIGKFLVSLQL